MPCGVPDRKKMLLALPQAAQVMWQVPRSGTQQGMWTFWIFADPQEQGFRRVFFLLHAVFLQPIVRCATSQHFAKCSLLHKKKGGHRGEQKDKTRHKFRSRIASNTSSDQKPFGMPELQSRSVWVLVGRQRCADAFGHPLVEVFGA